MTFSSIHRLAGVAPDLETVPPNRPFLVGTAAADHAAWRRRVDLPNGTKPPSEFSTCPGNLCAGSEGTCRRAAGLARSANRLNANPIGQPPARRFSPTGSWPTGRGSAAPPIDRCAPRLPPKNPLHLLTIGRSASEPQYLPWFCHQPFGELFKDNCGLRRNWLKRSEGDVPHPVLCAAGYNLRWWMRVIARMGLQGLLAVRILVGMLERQFGEGASGRCWAG